MTFTAVRTTRIYCRDGCPATPLRKNSTSYTEKAAAEAAGYRPCRRCHPDREAPVRPLDTAPQVVCRALDLIADGYLDSASTADLASHLGISERHFRRVFEATVGASPSGVARSRRAHLGKQLLEETDLSVTDVAWAAGFGSVRQLNRVFQDVFQSDPLSIRRRGQRQRLDTNPGSLRLRLRYNGPLDHVSTLAFHRSRAIDQVESVSDRRYQRTIRVDGQPGYIALEPDPQSALIWLDVMLPTYRQLGHVVAGARRLFDLDGPAGAADEALSSTPTLGDSVATHPGVRVPRSIEGFELAVRAIVGQQISVASARSVLSRIAARFGDEVSVDQARDLTKVFPTAGTLAHADVRDLPMPGRRAETIKTLAHEVAVGRLDLGPASDRDEVRARLLEINGIGPWTADYIAMRVLDDHDQLPTGDVVLKRALARLDTDGEDWRPYRSYATVRLWAGD